VDFHQGMHVAPWRRHPPRQIPACRVRILAQCQCNTTAAPSGIPDLRSRPLTLTSYPQNLFQFNKVEELLQLCSGVSIFTEEPTAAAEDVSHHSEVEDLVRQSAMHQPEEPCSRPLRCK
jgi:hypothetical protein